MNIGKTLAVCSVIFIGISSWAQSGAVSASGDFSRAMKFYENGMYERARSVFESVASSSGDQVARGYSVLCSAKLKTEGYQTLIDSYDRECPSSPVRSMIHYQYGLNLFDDGDYPSASAQFAKVGEKDILRDEIPQFMFKRAYSWYGEGKYDIAAEGFRSVQEMPYGDFTAPSRYALGYIAYHDKDFDTAIDWFSQSAKDPRFQEMSEYYILECKFMKKDYNYVTKNGPELYEKVPQERKPHLARILSESYLVKGDTGKAKLYYDKNVVTKPSMGRADYFYAGSLLYATGDFQGAVDNYTMMTHRTDSLGQIANYQLGYSYIQTKNKVAAMDAFRDASRFGYSPDIQEDAWFNYAKLSFDLNHDTSPFFQYMDKYSSKKKGDIIYSYMALASLYNHDYAGAVAAYDNIDELDDEQKSNYMKANYLRANQLISNGSWRDAIPCLKAAAYYSDKHDPFNQLATYWLGEAYYNDRNYSQAAEVYTDLYNLSALDRRTEGALLPYNLAYSYFQGEDYDNAAKWFDKYLSGKSPVYARDAAVRRADCDFIRQDYENAIESYDKAVKVYGDTDDLYPQLRSGIAYGLMGKNKKKIEVLSAVNGAALETPYYSEALYELGRAYVDGKNEEEAVKCFKTLKANTKDENYAALALIELGMISRNASRYDQALAYYKQVVEDMPRSEYADDALLAIESIYQAKGQTDEYLAFAEKMGVISGKSDSEKEAIYFNAAEQMFLAGNYEKALSSLSSYGSRYPEGEKLPRVWFYMAECYKNMGMKEQACDYYAKAVGAGDGSFDEPATLSLAALSYSMQKYTDAYSAYESLLGCAKIAGNVHTARMGMMRSAFGAREYADALTCADTVLDDKASSADDKRLAEYVKAKSWMATSNREEALSMFERLARRPSTDEGAEAAYTIIQNTYDEGRFDEVEDKVYKFASAAPDQSYWLAKAFIVLGDSFMEKDNVAQAKATFESVKDGYQPSGMEDDVLDNVNMRLSKLKKISSK